MKRILITLSALLLITTAGYAQKKHVRKDAPKSTGQHPYRNG